MSEKIFKQIANGRTDLVFDYVSKGHAATSADQSGVPLIKWSAYYGDVSAIRFLLAKGESLDSLGYNLDLNGAAFHGHWRLCQFLIEQGADVNKPLPDTGETALHAALCTTERLAHDVVVKVLLAHGADPNRGQASGRDRMLHARLPNEKRNASPSRRGVWQRGDDRDVVESGRHHRGQRHEWRFSAQLGELAFASGLDPEKALLRRV